MSEEGKDAISKIKRLIDNEIEKIDDDDRYHYPEANVRTNAPLALIQTGLSEKMKLLYSLRYEVEKIEKDRL